MNVLLTGPTGVVGKHTLDKLLNLGYHVSVIELKNRKTKKILKKYNDKIKIIYGSITDKKLVNEAVKHKDIVIHLAALIPPVADMHPGITKQVNYYGTKNIVDAIKKHNKNCFLMFASSISVYGDRLDSCDIRVGDKVKINDNDYYAKVKKETEDMIRESDINYAIYRLTAIMDKPKLNKLMFHMPLDTKLEIMTAEDTARAFVNGIKHKEKLNKNIYNVSGGEKCRTTYKDFLKNVFKIYGLNYKYLDEEAFATYNFHCAYYSDGEILENLIHFRKDTLNSYYRYLNINTKKITKILTKLFSFIIIKILNNKSEPKKSKNKKEEKRFFK